MMKRIAAIVFIFLCTAATWIGLGMTVTQRTDEYDKKLRGAVGGPIRNGNLATVLPLAPGQSEFVEVGYATSGMDEWCCVQERESPSSRKQARRRADRCLGALANHV